MICSRRWIRVAASGMLALVLGLAWMVSGMSLASRTWAAVLHEVDPPPEARDVFLDREGDDDRGTETIMSFAGRPKLEPALLRRLADQSADPDQPLRVIVVLSPTAGLVNSTQHERQDVVATILARRQSLSQAREPLAATLRRAARRGDVVEERALWIIHALGLTVRPAFVAELAASMAVAEIRLDHYRSYVEQAPALPDMPAATSEITPVWGLDRVRAPEVWATLEVSGTGAVVAVMDTGVDWMHPALMAQYRGYLGKGRFDHSGAWFDAVNGGSYPYDDHGHGTHVTGSAVGGVGDTATGERAIGVAPGASWIGVKVLNTDGYGYDSWILSGFQWLLAPGGDPSLAPDVVNASWSSSDRRSTRFLPAIEALWDADIFPVFAAGNEGPSASSVGSPASNPGVFAVGASDADDEVANFSGRGPSPWGAVKPQVVAPGVSILSSVPGGVYAANNGTSMATPHVAGLGALIRSVSPTMPVSAMARLITETAQPLGATVPNPESGWGRIDAQAAMMRLLHPGDMTGVVRDRDGHALAGAVVSADEELEGVVGMGRHFETRTDGQGHYRLVLPAARYTVRAWAFGYDSESFTRVAVMTGETQALDFTLTAQPTGGIRGQVRVGATGSVPTRTVVVRAMNTPVSTTVDATGAYVLALPEGVYTLQARGLGYRLATTMVTVTAGSLASQNFRLDVAPTLLLIDEGAWYYGSQIDLWRSSLNALQYVYDEVRIKEPVTDVPLSATLQLYDVVLWSSPLGSPGLVRGAGALYDYLDAGGRLLVSGQDVAFFDVSGYGYGGLNAYLYDQIGVQYVDDSGEMPYVNGSGLFDGLRLRLNGGSGADNQVAPDVIAVRKPDLASQIWSYDDGSTAGAAADVCVPYRALFFGFGFEGIADASGREAVMARSIDWLTTAPLTVGVTLDHLTNPVLVAEPGDRVTHVMRLRHVAYAGVTETVQLGLSGAAWPTDLALTSVDLPPCRSTTVTVTVTLPPDAGVNHADVVTVTASVASLNEPVALAITSKTPAPVLLVDDERWYPVEQHYMEALDDAGIAFDRWDTSIYEGHLPVAGSPPTDTLIQYPVVIWFTGYDWYKPILAEEASRLVAYLADGGSLLLSSQDFFYYHQDGELAEMMGIATGDGSYKVELAAGVVEHPASGAWGPVVLDYPFPNWSHVVEPAPGVDVVVRGQVGQPAALAMDAGPGRYRTLFSAMPLEALPLPIRSEVLARYVGWLSPLGDSTWEVTPGNALPGEPVTFTLALHNRGAMLQPAEAIYAVPDGFSLITSTVPPGMEIDPVSGKLAWSGMLGAQEAVTLSWTATWVGAPPVTSPTGLPSVTLRLPSWGFEFVREAPFYGAGPDFSRSHWEIPAGVPRSGAPVTLTFALQNSGPATASMAHLTLWLMQGTSPITATDPTTEGMVLHPWAGAIVPGGSYSITAGVRAWWNPAYPARIDALIQDGAGHRLEQRYWLNVAAWSSYLPIILR